MRLGASVAQEIFPVVVLSKMEVESIVLKGGNCFGFEKVFPL